jgi:hypothetical protein
VVQGSRAPDLPEHDAKIGDDIDSVDAGADKS